MVGMSGGVDSALAAALLKSQGHDVMGVTLKLYDYAKTVDQTTDDKKHCHPDAFIHNAQNVCAHLNIPHQVIDHRHVFKDRIVDPFMAAYKDGQTPLPCVTCNRDVKTAALHTIMHDLGGDALATGHYVRRVDTGSDVQMHQGVDARRDQSFFLFALTQQHVNDTYFPLGQYSKDETRAQADKMGLCVSRTPSSQDLCFIADRSYRSMFADNPGNICTEEGTVLGQHRGVSHYTVGQRQGLGLGGHHTDPLYVIALNASTNTVVVGPRHRLARTSVALHSVNWLAPDLRPPSMQPASYDVAVKMRSSSMTVPARVTIDWSNQTAHVALNQADYSIAPGQACVFYQGTRVLGGGWISEQQGA